MESYEEWDMTIPAIPPRSRLYHLEPVGIGTPYVESLTSYITRLAMEHNVSSKYLILFLFDEKTDKNEERSYSYFNRSYYRQLRVLNGAGPTSEKWVNLLEEATGCTQLHYLTMLPWKNVISNDRLLRLQKAWCPHCYEEWMRNYQVVYEPLIWMLDCVHICIKHHQQLISLCPVCQKTASFFAQSLKPGFCPYCYSYLGYNYSTLSHQKETTDSKGMEYDSWVFEAVGELLALAPTLHTPILRKTLRESLETHLSSFRAETFAKSIIALESSLNLGRSFIQKLINEKRIPYLYNFLKMCYALHTTPAKFYLGSNKDTFNKLSFILEHLPVSPRVNGHKKGSHLTTEDIDYIRTVLVTIVDLSMNHLFPALERLPS